jgi:hypothetical protein
MPQLTKRDPRKTYSGFPANLTVLEYMTLLGRVHLATEHKTLTASEIRWYVFYHATRPFGISIFSPGGKVDYSVEFFSSNDSGFPGIITPITPNQYGFQCTNQFQPTVFDIDFGTLAASVTHEHDFIDGESYLAGNPLSFFVDSLGFICKPDQYYVFYLRNNDASTANLSIRFMVVDFLGVN